MMFFALAALAGGAVAGLFLATRHFRRLRLPVWVAALHGVGGAIGFALVLLTVVHEPSFRPARESLYLLIATVGFGCVNLLFHVRKVRHRTSLIALHAACAVSGVGLLVRALVLHGAGEVPAAPPDLTPAAHSTGALVAESERQTPPTMPAAPAAPPEASTFAARTIPNPPASAQSDSVVADTAVRSALTREIHFEPGSSAMTVDSTSAVAEIASVLKAHPEVELLEVQGHADERGDSTRNIAITRARAMSVVNALVGSGVSRKRLHAAGYGAKCSATEECQAVSPPSSCHAPEQWEKDRRVSVVVLRNTRAAIRGEIICAAGASLIPSEDASYKLAAK